MAKFVKWRWVCWFCDWKNIFRKVLYWAFYFLIFVLLTFYFLINDLFLFSAKCKFCYFAEAFILLVTNFIQNT